MLLFLNVVFAVHMVYSVTGYEFRIPALQAGFPLFIMFSTSLMSGIAAAVSVTAGWLVNDLP